MEAGDLEVQPDWVRMTIRNIPYKYSCEEAEAILISKLSSYGPLHSIRVIPQKETKNKGYAFIYGTSRLYEAKADLANWMVDRKPLELLVGNEKGKPKDKAVCDEEIDSVIAESIELLLDAAHKTRETTFTIGVAGDILRRQKVHIKGKDVQSCRHFLRR